MQHPFTYQILGLPVSDWIGAILVAALVALIDLYILGMVEFPLM
jgi:hypothetical protein